MNRFSLCERHKIIKLLTRQLTSFLYFSLNSSLIGCFSLICLKFPTCTNDCLLNYDRMTNALLKKLFEIRSRLINETNSPIISENQILHTLV